MWWKVVLKAAVALGLDQWAKRKAVALVGKLKAKAEAKAKNILEAGGASGGEEAKTEAPQ